MRNILFALICCFMLAACATQNPYSSINKDDNKLNPDLEVIAIEIGDISDNHQSLEVLIINNGNTSAAPSQILAEFIYESEIFKFSQEIPSVKPNSIQVVSLLAPSRQRFHYFISSKLKEVSLQVSLDISGHVEESNEWNNQFAQVFGYDELY